MKTLNNLSKIMSSILIACFINFAIISCGNNVDNNKFETPTNDSVAASTSKANTVTVSWNAVDNDEITYYWIYFGTTNDTSLFTRSNVTAHAGLWVTNGIGSYDVSLSESGTHYFWVKAANAAYASTGKSSNFS